jgi:hypothetical protein
MCINAAHSVVERIARVVLPAHNIIRVTIALELLNQQAWSRALFIHRCYNPKEAEAPPLPQEKIQTHVFFFEKKKKKHASWCLTDTHIDGCSSDQKDLE